MTDNQQDDQQADQQTDQQMAYCVKCREKRQMQDPKIETNDKGRRMMKGTCPECSTNMTRFLPNE